MVFFKFNAFHYAGIGSRKIHSELSIEMIKLGFALALCGGVLESGAADGSDTSFEVGAKMAYDFMCSMDSSLPKNDYSRVMNVHLGWRGFNGRPASSGYDHSIPVKATSMTEPFHSGWEYLSDGAKQLMSRNIMQVLTRTLLDPVKFVMCFTADGAKKSVDTSSKTGGTGQAIRIADHYNVNLTNLGNKEDFSRAITWRDEYFEKIKIRHGIDLSAYVNDKISSFTAFSNLYKGNLADILDGKDIDMIVHDCNIYNENKDAASSIIFSEFPGAMVADKQTKSGNKKKIGTYSEFKSERNGKEFTVINAYTQTAARDIEAGLGTDYEAVRGIFREINKQHRNKVIGIPRIGTFVGNGCWFTISNIIKTELKNNRVVLIDDPSLLSLEPQKKKNHHRNNQLEIDI